MNILEKKAMIDFTNSTTLMQTFRHVGEKDQPHAHAELKQALSHGKLDAVSFCIALSMKNELEEKDPTISRDSWWWVKNGATCHKVTLS
jgi:hypothetical protein